MSLSELNEIEPRPSGSYHICAEDILLSPGEPPVSPGRISYPQNGMMYKLSRANEVNKHLVQGALDYTSAITNQTNPYLFSVVWSSLYYTVSDIIGRECIQNEMEIGFGNALKSVFGVIDPQTQQTLLSMHHSMQNDFASIGITPLTLSSITEVHSLTLTFAKYFGLYQNSIVDGGTLARKYLAVVDSVRNALHTPVKPPQRPQPSPPPVTTTTSKPHKQPPASFTPPSSKKKQRMSPWIIFPIVFVLLVCIVSLTPDSDYSTTSVPVTTTPKPALEPRARPVTGQVLAGSTGEGSEITIIASASEDYVVTLKTTSDSLVCAFYVRAGDIVTVPVPEGNFYVYFASGDEWYGYGKGLMFGENTTYSKDDEIVDFSQYTIQYTLYPVTNGNFSETPISENEFF